MEHYKCFKPPTAIDGQAVEQRQTSQAIVLRCSWVPQMDGLFQGKSHDDLGVPLF